MFSQLLLCIILSFRTWCVKWNKFPKFRYSLPLPSSEHSQNHIPQHSNNHSHRHDHLTIRNSPMHIVHFYKQYTTMLRSHRWRREAIKEQM
jgi:hypothetical protein